MIYKYNQRSVNNARTLRKIWRMKKSVYGINFWKGFQFTVNRQKNIGNYIVDFFIASQKVVIELDGSQHGTPKNREADQEKMQIFAHWEFWYWDIPIPTSIKDSMRFVRISCVISACVQVIWKSTRRRTTKVKIIKYFFDKWDVLECKKIQAYPKPRAGALNSLIWIDLSILFPHCFFK